MLCNLDAAVGDALHSFSQALAQAQQTLQTDQARLESTAALLHDLTTENTALSSHKVHNAQELQRLDALRTEKAKLTRQAGHKREQIQACQARIKQLTQPRLARQAAVEEQRQAVKAQRRQYCARAAQVHAYAAQFMAPQNSLTSLQHQLRRLQEQQREKTEALRQLREVVEVLQHESASLKAMSEPPVVTPAEAADDADARKKSKDAELSTEAGSSTCAAGIAVFGGPTEEEEEGANGAATSAAATKSRRQTDAEEASTSTARRAAQHAAYTRARTHYAEEESQLRQRRGELKEVVLLLCHEIEAADAAQQGEQRAYHDALNEAGSTGAFRVCASCHGDLLRGFS